MNYIYRQYSNLYNIYILFLQFNSPIFYLICPAFLPHNIIQRCRFVNRCLHTLLRYDIKKQIQGYFIPTIYRIFFRCLDITVPNTPSRQQAVIGYDIIDEELQPIFEEKKLTYIEKEIYKIPVPAELGEAPEYKPRSYNNKRGDSSKRRSFGGKRNNNNGKKGNNRPSSPARN